MNPLQDYLRDRIAIREAEITRFEAIRDEELTRPFLRRRQDLLLMLCREELKCRSALDELTAALRETERR